MTDKTDKNKEIRETPTSIENIDLTSFIPKVTSLKVHPHVWSEFKKFCRERGLSMSYVVTQILLGFLRGQKTEIKGLNPVIVNINVAAPRVEAKAIEVKEIKLVKTEILRYKFDKLLERIKEVLKKSDPENIFKSDYSRYMESLNYLKQDLLEYIDKHPEIIKREELPGLKSLLIKIDERIEQLRIY